MDYHSRQEWAQMMEHQTVPTMAHQKESTKVWEMALLMEQPKATPNQ
jgi:hypothetical protein